jgi:hypothetical protein
MANEINIWDTINLLNPLAKFRTLLSRRDTIGLFAKFTHEVISIYEGTPESPSDSVIAFALANPAGGK